ncbi:MAG: AbrB/MazE/SpoVT family DNA-binding domain-containing protein [Chloroflexota bacterium]|nr:MAG: AbrB/MazE/SpoVT family DNA-binding domain-containing protein [Chloroflexota bacterium]
MAESKLVRVQDKGQVTLPVGARRRMGLKKGDLVAVVETDEGLLITPRVVLATKALDEMGALLREKGVTLEEWIESGREMRGQLARERSDIDSDSREN